MEVFIGGDSVYYEFEINLLGMIYEGMFVWVEVYDWFGFD